MILYDAPLLVSYMEVNDVCVGMHTLQSLPFSCKEWYLKKKQAFISSIVKEISKFIFIMMWCSIWMVAYMDSPPKN